MNLAFPALVVFILILPGIILRYTYTSGFWGWSSPTSMRRISDDVAYGVIFALMLHMVWLTVSEWLGARPDVRSVLAILSGNFGPEDEWLERSLSAIADHRRMVATYLLTQYAFAALFGLGLHWGVRKLRLDHISKALRFDNYWYYMLTAEVIQFKERADKRNGTSFTGQVDGVYLSATVDIGNDTLLYRGLVKDFTYDRDGNLDTIVLIDAHRPSLSADRDPAEPGGPLEDPSRSDNPRYYAILGDYFVLKYAQISTLNLDYFWIDIELEVEDSYAASIGEPPGEKS